MSGYRLEVTHRQDGMVVVRAHVDRHYYAAQGRDRAHATEHLVAVLALRLRQLELVLAEAYASNSKAGQIEGALTWDGNE